MFKSIMIKWEEAWIVGDDLDKVSSLNQVCNSLSWRSASLGFSEESLKGVELLKFENTLFKSFFLIQEELYFSSVSALSSLVHFISEWQLLDNIFLFSDVVIKLFNLAPVVDELFLKFILLFLRESNLDQFKEDLEMAEEVDVFCWLITLNNISSNWARFSLIISVDFGGHGSQGIFVKILWFTVSDLLTIDLSISD